MAFVVGDYSYKVITAGVNVYATAVDKTKSTYGDIPATVTYGGETYRVVGAPYCFEDCVNLTTVPNVSFSTWSGSAGAGNNLNGFLKGCTSLTSVDIESICDGLPVPAQLSEFCSGCTSLQTATMPSTAYRTVSEMFKGCTSLTSIDRIPVLVDTTQSPSTPSGTMQYGSMFEGCSSLNDLSVYGWDASLVDKWEDMFEDCADLDMSRLILFR